MGISTLLKRSFLFVSLSVISIEAFASSQYDFFRTKSSGNWDNVNTWESSLDGENWEDADLVPDEEASGIEIVSGHKISMTSDVGTNEFYLYELIMNSGSELVINPGTIFYLQNANIAGLIEVQGFLFTNGSLNFLSGGHLKVSLSSIQKIPNSSWAVGSTCEIISVSVSELLFQTESIELYNLVY
ncbi:hypothetical protein EIM50_21455, partial [Pseudoxanthomonas sp. SGD-10]